MVLGIADHAVRDKVQYGKKRVIGALFGTQQGRSVEVVEVMGTPIDLMHIWLVAMLERKAIRGFKFV